MRYALIVIPLLLLPVLLNDFWLTQVMTRALILGIVALSLSFLAKYLGVVSFAQAAMAGAGGYTIAYFGPNSVNIGIELPFWISIPLALFLATAFGGLIGCVARRSRGIYAIMITLAIGIAFFYFTRQNYALFNGWTGFSGVRAPLIGGISLRAPVPLYFMSLLSAVVSMMLVSGFARSPMGLAIQAVRDAPGRVMALGISVSTPIIAAFAFSGLLAGTGGILNVWYQERISSFSVGFGPIIDILIIAVIGGLRYPSGAFIGAIVFVMLDTFAVDLVDRERFNTLIGTVLLLIVIFAPNGLQQLVMDGAAKLRRAKQPTN
ncbi:MULTISPECIES: branched-chain amino acid ABC transporter permease [Pacificibacter]|uniref:branched-chain amino acid ABC transporter permease n=1 Tax=Pacificibacter TaxID=1042323 RepID=UPI001C087B88|nr:MULTISPECIES: branched-chain amino acid ABC transporter permease [Pacificibacter]MBU2936377.1 branched-chain amino acid ABC transporter permease [Pacificibacter marinus]MDO6617342.1 branched-chain amino acid ABC transporter permease [Pacificibacter sp. 1_MG-2023]